jgi:transcriptional regulator with XRE-family HTH domain
MDMQIDAKRVRAERERRAWSQEQLAEASGLALRTVQRIESSGHGSYETVKALAAVFECGIEALRVVTAQAPAAPAAPAAPGKSQYWAAAAVAALIASFAFFNGTAAASQVLLDVVLSLNEQQTGKHQLIAADGSDAEIRLEGQLRLIVTPRVNADGSILLSIRLYEADGESFKLVSEPKLLAVNNLAAAVNLTSVKGSVFGIAITPHRLAD